MRYDLVDDGYVTFALFFYLLLDRLSRLILNSGQLVTAGPQTKKSNVQLTRTRE